MNALLLAVLSLGGIVSNPERGWRFEMMVGLEADERPGRHIRDNWPVERYRSEGVTVAQAYCYLTKYEASGIAEAKLTALQADFDRARRDGIKFLLRFAYERTTDRMHGPDLEWILSHIRELTPIVRRNADVIYCLQTGWVGAWGEFHSSFAGIEKDPGAVAQIVAATLEMLPESRSTMMRRPFLRTQTLRMLGERDAARIGIFNDATLCGNPTESDTFMGDPAAYAKMDGDAALWTKWAEPGGADFDAMRAVGLVAPVDGELFWTSQGVRPIHEHGLSAILRFKEHHYTTFSLVHGNSELDRTPTPGSVDRWKVTPVTQAMLAAYGLGDDPGYFEGSSTRTAYEYIRDHLGYRLVLESLEMRGIPAEGAHVTFVARLRNVGFAHPVNPRTTWFVLAPENGPVTEFESDFDCRRLAAGSTAEIVCTSVIPKGAGGDISPTIGLWLPDAAPTLRYRPEYAVETVGSSVKILNGRRINFR